jgi:hypothetical protein
LQWHWEPCINAGGEYFECHKPHSVAGMPSPPKNSSKTFWTDHIIWSVIKCYMAGAIHSRTLKNWFMQKITTKNINNQIKGKISIIWFTCYYEWYYYKSYNAADMMM